tara:strand:- start:2386 stop:3603 length:1218 start_codon:yes stop_codon:yes gene_type:complete
MAITLPSDLRQVKTRLTPALADYLFVENHNADAPLVVSWKQGVEAGTIVYGIAHPDTVKFPDHVLVYVDTERIGKDRSKTVDFYYAAIGVNQDAYNWVYTGYSGSKYKKFTRKYLIKREAITTEVVIPLNTADTVKLDYVLYDTRLTTTGSKELDSVYVMRESTYILIDILQGTTYDGRLKEVYDYQETIVFGDYDLATNNGGLDYTSPLLGSAQPINASWTNVRTGRRGDAEDFTTRSYTTYINHYWPAVLVSYEVDTINGKDDPDTDDDESGLAFLLQDYIVESAYNGATKALITETLYVDEDWSSPPSPDTVHAPMLPTPIQARGTFSSLNIQSCLHDIVTYSEIRGDISKWTNGTYTWNWAATNHLVWPDELVISSVVQPTAKGWTKRTTKVFKPLTTYTP